MVCVECLIGKQNKPTLFKVTEPVTIGFGDFGISISLDVFCRLRSPSNCVSDGHFYCFRSSIVVTLDGTRCVGGASGVCVVIIPIVKYSTSPTNIIVCTSCPANKYSAAVGASFCAECEAGKYSAAGSTNASNCRVELRQSSKMDAAAGVTGTGPSAYQSYRMPPRHRYGTEWKMVSHNDNGGPRHLRLRRSH